MANTQTSLTFDMIGRDKGAAKNIRDVGKASATSSGQVDKLGKSTRSASGDIDKVGAAARLAQDDLDKVGESAEGLGEKFSGLAKAGGAVAAIGLGAAFVNSLDIEAANDKLAGQLDLTKKESARIGGIAGELYAGAYGESMEDVNTAVGAVMSSIDGMSHASTKALETTTKAALNFAAAFDVDVSRAAQIAGQIVRNDLAANAGQAFDLLIKSSQSVPAAVREDLLDAADEYGTFFRTLGFEGKQAFGVLVKGAEQGMYGIDKTGDAIKEFTIRSTDMSATSVQAYKAIGLNAREMSNAFLEGGDTARKAFDKVITGLISIEEPQKRANTAIKLFGVPLEDLNVHDIPKFLAGLYSTNNRLKDVAGSAEQLDTTLGTNAKTSLTQFTRQIQTFATDVLGNNVIPKLETVASNLQNNFGPAVQNVQSGIKALPDPMKDFGVALGIAAFAGPKVVTAMQNMTAAASSYISNIGTAGTRTQQLGAAAKTAAGIAGLGVLIASTQETSGSLRTLEGVAGGALLGFAAGGPWGAAIGAGAGLLGGLATQTGNATDAQRAFAKSQMRSKEASDNLRASLNQTTGAMTHQTEVEMARAIAKTRDLNVIMDEVGVSLGTMTKAALGNGHAMDVIVLAAKAVNKEYGYNAINIKALKQEIMGLGAPMRQESKLIRETEAATKDKTKSVTNLEGALLDLPQKVVTDVLQLGAEASQKDVERLQKQYDLTPKQVATILLAEGIDKAIFGTEKFRDRVNSIMDSIRDEGVNISLSAQASKTAAQIAQFAESFHATGGMVRGQGNGTSDSVRARLSPGEYVIREKVARRIYPFLGALNSGQAEAMEAAGAKSQRGRIRFAQGGKVMAGKVGMTPYMNTSKAIDQTRDYATYIGNAADNMATAWGSALSKAIAKMLAFGGNGMPLGPGGTLSLGQIAAGQAFAKSQAGKPYIWAGVGPGGYDCSGFQSAVLNSALGQYPYSRRGSTGTMPWAGSASGVGRYTIGWFTGSPGHTSGNIGGLGVESRGGDGVVVGSSATSPLSSMFNGLMHYDRGGPLRPGLTLAYNGTGRTERVVKNGNGGPRRYEITITNWHTGEGYMAEIARGEIEEEARHASGGL